MGMARRWVASVRRLCTMSDEQTPRNVHQNVAPPGEPSEDVVKAKRFIEAASARLMAGDIDGAEGLYHEALFHDGSSADALYGLGIAKWRRDAAEAEGWADLALVYDRAHVPATKLLSHSLFAQGKREDALAVLTRAGRMGDRSVGLQMASARWAQWGFINEEIGHYGRAELYLRDALRDDLTYATRYAMVGIYRFDPFLADAHHALARVLQRQARSEEARTHYHLARRIDPAIELDPMHREIIPSKSAGGYFSARAK